MSYCRFSSDNFRSDIYAYEAAEGFVIHVAASRLVGEVPPVDWESPDTPTLLASLRAQSDALAAAERAPIDLPHAGGDFLEADLDEFEARLRYLADLGYHVPAHVFEAIRRERAAEQAV